MPAAILPYVPAIAKGLVGGLQSILGGGARRKAEKDLERHANSYQVSPGILDFYNKALARYSANPYTSQYYGNQKRAIDRNMVTAINASQDRRGALATISALNQQTNDAYAKAGANAENMQAQALGQLGTAAGMKNQAEQKKFDMLYNLKAMKAGQSATLQNQGMQNLYSGLGDYTKLKYLLGGNNPVGGYSASDVTASNKPRRNLTYIPSDEQLIP
jgi:hypothetical protein